MCLGKLPCNVFFISVALTLLSRKVRSASIDFKNEIVDAVIPVVESKLRQLYSLDTLFQPPDDTASIDQAVYNLRSKLDTTPRIVGGVPVEANPSYGFSAGSKLCGGTLIHPDILLTAAHCAGNFVDGLLMGGTTLDGLTSTFFPVTSELPHPNYDTITDDNDVMLVKISSPVPAPLQVVNYNPVEPPVGSTVSVIGHGATTEGGSSSSVLLGTENTVLSFADCNAYYGTISEERMICMGDAAGGRDSCQGDSGGPMLFNGLQVGIVSFGDGCARPNVPSVFARTSGFEAWIKNGICDLSSVPPASCDVAETTAPVGAPTLPPSIGRTVAPMELVTGTPVSAGTPSPVVDPVTSAPVAAPVVVVTPGPTRTPTMQAGDEPTIQPSTISPAMQSEEEPTVQPTTTPTQQPSPIQVPIDVPIGASVAPVLPPVPLSAANGSGRPPATSPASPNTPKASRPSAVINPAPTKVPTFNSPASSGGGGKGMGMGNSGMGKNMGKGGMGKNMGKGNGKGDDDTFNPTTFPTPSAAPIMNPITDVTFPTVLPTSGLLDTIPPSPMPIEGNGTGKGRGMDKGRDKGKGRGMDKDRGMGKGGGKRGRMGKGMKKRNDDDDCDDDEEDDDDRTRVSADSQKRISPLQMNGGGRMMMMGRMKVSARNIFDRYPASPPDTGRMRMKSVMSTANGMSRPRNMKQTATDVTSPSGSNSTGRQRKRSRTPYSVWKLISGKGKKNGGIEDEDRPIYIRPLLTHQRPHVTLEMWFRNHLVKKVGAEQTDNQHE